MSWHDVFCWLRGVSSIAVGMITYAYGDLDGLLIALFVVIVIDYATGLIKSGISHTLSSAVGFKGILKKILILLVVALAHVIDNCVGSGETWRNIAIVFYICNEGLSILENCVDCGLPVPDKLKVLLQQMENDDKEKEEKQEKRLLEVIGKGDKQNGEN